MYNANLFENFEKLCNAVSVMADVIRRQQTVIELYGIEKNDPELNKKLEQIKGTTDKLGL